MATRYQQFTVAEGDWFSIMTEPSYDEGPARVIIERLVGWCVAIEVDKDGVEHLATQRIEGISAMGAGKIHDHVEYEYVCGRDRCPDGRTWLEVFNEAPHARHDFRVITKIVGSWTLAPLD